MSFILTPDAEDGSGMKVYLAAYGLEGRVPCPRILRKQVRIPDDLIVPLSKWEHCTGRLPEGDQSDSRVL